MKHDELPPMDDDVERLLRGERACGPAPTTSRHRVLRRLELQTVFTPPPAGRWAGRLRWGAAIIGLCALGVAIVVALRVVPPPPPQVVVLDAPSRSEADRAPRGAEAPRLPPPVVASGTADVPPSRATPPTESEADLSIERRLLDEARFALMRGEPSDALTPLEQHGRRFPHGKLGEEREALAVQALARAGRADEARRRGAAFRARFPSSLFLLAVDDALGALPNPNP